MTSAQRLKLRKFFADVLQHSAAVRYRFSTAGGRDLEDVTREEQLVVLVEEVGKLSRAINKLRIVQDQTTAASWEHECRHRLLTIASVAARIRSTL